MKKYIIKESNYIYTNIDELFERLYDMFDPSTEEFDDYLDECYQEYEICGYTFKPSKILYEIDQECYYDEFNSYKDSRWDDVSYEYKNEIENAEDGDEIDISELGETVQILEGYCDPLIDEKMIIVTENMSKEEIEQYLVDKGYMNDFFRKSFNEWKTYMRDIHAISFREGGYVCNTYGWSLLKDKHIYAINDKLIANFDV